MLFHNLNQNFKMYLCLWWEWITTMKFGIFLRQKFDILKFESKKYWKFKDKSVSLFNLVVLYLLSYVYFWIVNNMHNKCQTAVHSLMMHLMGHQYTDAVCSEHHDNAYVMQMMMMINIRVFKCRMNTTPTHKTQSQNHNKLLIDFSKIILQIEYIRCMHLIWSDFVWFKHKTFDDTKSWNQMMKHKS